MLNPKAAELMDSYSEHACTDITGFGLLGHALEVAAASVVCIALVADQVPLLPKVRDLVEMGLVPAGSSTAGGRPTQCTNSSNLPRRVLRLPSP